MLILYFYILISLLLFLGIIFYAKYILHVEVDVKKRWINIETRLRQELKQSYLMSKKTEFISIRLTYLDNLLIKNTLVLRHIKFDEESDKIMLNCSSKIKPFGVFIVFIFSLIFSIASIYIFFLLKKTKEKAMCEMITIKELSESL